MMVRNVLASITSILTVWTAISSAAPATPEQPSPGPDQFIVSRLSSTLGVSADRTSFGFPKSVVLELLKIDSLQRPLVRYMCFKTATSEDEWADKTLTCVPVSQERTAPETLRDPEERQEPITPGDFGRAQESNAVEEGTFTVEIASFVSLLNFDLVFTRPNLPSQRTLVAHITPQYWRSRTSEDGSRVISSWQAPMDERFFRQEEP